MNDTHISNLTTLLMTKWEKFESKYMNDDTYECGISLDIDSIDGVKISYSHIKLCKHYLRLQIVDYHDLENNNFVKWNNPIRKLFYYGDDINHKIIPTYDMVKKCVTSLSAFLENVKLDTLQGCFTDEPVNNSEMRIAFGSLGKCKSRYDTCSVCHSNTKTSFTKCKHKCCLRCISNIVSQTDCDNFHEDCDISVYIKCPICRDKIPVDV